MIEPEPRSFAPREGRTVRPDPIPSNPTNDDLGRAILQVHECVEQARLEAKKMDKAAAKRLQRHALDVRAANSELARIRTAIGLDESGHVATKTPATMSQGELLSKFGGVVFGAFVLLRILEQLWPGLEVWGRAALDHLWNYALHG